MTAANNIPELFRLGVIGTKGRARRYVSGTAEGWSAENVAAEACRLYPMRRFSARDVIAPRGLMVGEAA